MRSRERNLASELPLSPFLFPLESLPSRYFCAGFSASPLVALSTCMRHSLFMVAVVPRGVPCARTAPEPRGAPASIAIALALALVSGVLPFAWAVTVSEPNRKTTKQVRKCAFGQHNVRRHLDSRLPSPLSLGLECGRTDTLPYGTRHTVVRAPQCPLVRGQWRRQLAR
ncbi:hypothetical protein C8Q73DRAFT_693806 [Cubamyces lactineus]|nr:hypothetical protein C8Q73DRAFT_693806 [Cubamyces lactineus]